MKTLKFIIALVFVLIGVSLRLLPHPANLAPIAAIALFSGVYLSRKTALLLPLAAMLISDMFIGSYQLSLMFFVYGSFLLIVFLGFWLKKHKRWYAIGGSAILSALLFFVITNFAVWVFTPWYAKTLAGLIQCFVMALPFFKNTLVGDLFYTAVFFGAYELINYVYNAHTRIVSAKPVAASFNRGLDPSLERPGLMEGRREQA